MKKLGGEYLYDHMTDYAKKRQSQLMSSGYLRVSCVVAVSKSPADLTIVYKSPQVDMGYDISDYKDIDPKYGTLADVDELIAKLGQHDMKLMMDLVVNHTSNEVMCQDVDDKWPKFLIVH
jgi:hypothetical protein